MSRIPSLEIGLSPELLQIFFPLFQQGVRVEVEVGCTVKELLTGQFGISADYLAGRITTLFLNSKAIDDAATAVVLDGAVLALSGAMPGLVGATMRSGGHLAAMRGNMTYQNATEEVSARQGQITLKLFNLLLSELGPRVLQWGILLKVSQFRELLEAQPDRFRLRDCVLDGRAVSSEQLKNGQQLPPAESLVKLTVSFGEQ